MNCIMERVNFEKTYQLFGQSTFLAEATRQGSA